MQLPLGMKIMAHLKALALFGRSVQSGMHWMPPLLRTPGRRSRPSPPRGIGFLVNGLELHALFLAVQLHLLIDVAVQFSQTQSIQLSKEGIIGRVKRCIIR